MTWQSRAACRGMDQKIFYPGRGEGPVAAKAICANCPVTSECLDLALRTEEPRHRHGVFGGMAPYERRRRFDGYVDDRKKKRTACVNGHDFVDGSYQVTSNGTRRCLVCIREKPCNRGHTRTPETLGKDGHCLLCSRMRQAEWRRSKKQAA